MVRSYQCKKYQNSAGFLPKLQDTAKNDFPALFYVNLPALQVIFFLHNLPQYNYYIMFEY